MDAPTEKRCFKCGEVKSLSAFYKHPQMSDGHVNKSKECNKKDVIDNRKDKISYYREYDRKRGGRHTVESTRLYREKNPKKYTAHSKVGYALKVGQRVKQPCEVCGNIEVHGHHCDYDKPLEVMWLCAEHHVQWHSENGEGLNADVTTK